MKATVPHNFVLKKVTAPASKSYAQRAILAATLSHGACDIINTGKSEDVKHILQISKQLGAEVEASENSVQIKGFVHDIQNQLNCGESGLGVRLVTPIAAVLHNSFNITGKGSLLSRSMNEFQNFLPELGVEIKSNEGFLPLELKGKMRGGIVTIDGSMSSQFLSGLLMAAPLADKVTTIHVKNPTSIPYIQMTLEILKNFGIKFQCNEDFTQFRIPSQQNYHCSNYLVEGDWSGAAFWVVYGAIAGGINIQGLNKTSSQADLAILQAITVSGGSFIWENDELIVSPHQAQPFEFNATQCPDLFPALVVLAAAANGTSKITGAKRLIHKESNRALVLKEEFGKLGLKIDLEEDTMYINGHGNLNPGEIHSHNDHRIAMSAAIAATLTDGDIQIIEAESVSKSYPEFWQILKTQLS